MARRTSIWEVATSLRAAFGALTREPRYLGYALLVHAGFLLIFVMSFEWNSKPVASHPEVNVVQAVVVDESEVQKEMEKLRAAEARKQGEEEARLRRQREEAQRAEQQRKQAEEARKREEQRLADAKRQEEQARRQAEQQRKETEARRQAEEQKRQDDARKAAEQKRQEEAQRAAEQKHREEEARRAEEQRRQDEARRAEEARIAEEQRRRDEQAAAERARREQSEVERYVEVIRQQVERNWNKPANWTTGIRCTVHVKLIPGGDVVDVRITRSCGDPVFDSSVERAVHRASPLRVPPADSGLFDRFRDLEFVFNPQG